MKNAERRRTKNWRFVFRGEKGIPNLLRVECWAEILECDENFHDSLSHPDGLKPDGFETAKWLQTIIIPTFLYQFLYLI